MASARHSKATPRWGTDEKTVEASRRTMGGIDFDPCSEERFNAVVQATQYYSLLERGEDALKLSWFGRTLCNPPGGLVVEFWRYALTQPVEQLIWVGFSVEQLCILASEVAHPSDFSLCFLRKRIPFRRHDGFQGSPSHGNYCVGIGVSRTAFDREFGALGKVQHGLLALTGEYAAARDAVLENRDADAATILRPLLNESLLEIV